MPPTSLPVLSSRRQVLGAGLAAALASWAALGLVEDRRTSAARFAGRISVVGDSLTVGTVPYQSGALVEAGWTRVAVDAHRSRGVVTKAKGDPHTGLTAVDAIRTKSGDSDVWVVALGTNDAGIQPRTRYESLIRNMMDRIGGGHYVMWVNIFLPATPERQEGWNAALDAVAAERSDELFVCDWASLAAQNPQWLSVDLVHCTGGGYKQRAKAIAKATRTVVPSTPIITDVLRARRPGATNMAP